jgi:hypothetical protein
VKKPKKKKPAKHAAPQPFYITYSSAGPLIGHLMLIIETHEQDGRLRVHAELDNGIRVCFPAGVVVKQ